MNSSDTLTVSEQTEDLETQAPKTDNPKTAGEFFTAFYRHLSPVLLSILTFGLLGLRIAMGNWSYVDLFAPVAILLFWPLLEWLIHVHLLHKKPFRCFGKTWDLTVSNTHRAHHANPSDLSDITINTEVFPVVVPLSFALAYWLFPSAELATGALATFFALALHYEFCHFIGHTRWCPPLEYYRRRQRMHRLHHYRDEKLWWGVSTGLGDVLLGTAPDLKSVEKSPTVHNVHGLISQEN